MKKQFFWMMAAAVGCCSLISCSSNGQDAGSTVRLQGQLVDMGSQQVRMSYDGASSMLGDRRDVWLFTDADGRFDTTLVLKEPGYYNIGRNTLYLTPGDDLTLRITPDNEQAEFKGRGAVANHYMKYRLYPKGGSFLAAGRNLRTDFESTKKLVDSLASVRMHTLDTLTQVSETFKQLERARVQADRINSYIFYPSYSDWLAGAKTKEEVQSRYQMFMDRLTPVVLPLYRELLDESYLDVAVVRNVLSYQQDADFADRWFKNLSLPARTLELFACNQVIDDLRNEVSEQTVAKAQAMKLQATQPDFAAELESMIAQASALLPGQPAIDFSFTDVHGQKKHLSDFKGKVIYIDLWATWCGPCIKESPAFDALGMKYSDKEVIFLPVSTDTTTKPWLRFLEAHAKQLPQYHSNDAALKEGWAILYIPRFILIDRDFKIVNAYAPRPSSDEIVGLIDSVLNQKK